MSDLNVRRRGNSSHTVYTDYKHGPIGGEWTTFLNFERLLPFTDGLCEVIADESPHFKRYGNCYHKRQTLTRMDSNKVEYIHGDVKYEISNSAYFINSMAGFGYEAPDPGSLIAEACSVMKPSLGENLSLTNFILELRDLKRMFKLFDKTKSLIRNLAAGHLNYQFGWKPFVGDVIRLYDKLSNVEKTLSDYKSRCGVEQVRKFKKVLVDNENETHSFDDLPNHARKVEVNTRAVFHATMRYTYTVPQINSEHAKLKGVLDLLGLKANLSVFWEAIPFSFAVDWFINVDNFLRQFDTDYLESKVTILDFCYSIKSEEVAEYFVWPRPAESGSWTTAATVATKTYTRRRTIPERSIFGLELVDGFGARQVGLAAALLLA